MGPNRASGFGTGTTCSEMSIIDAIDANDTDAAIKWIEKTDDLNAKVRVSPYLKEWPLRYALKKKQSKIALALLAHGASVQHDTGYELLDALMDCIQEDDLETMQMILHLDPSCAYQFRKTYREVPIMLAARCGSSESLSILLQNGANVDYQNELTGEGPLHVAAEECRLAVAKILLSSGANIEMRNQAGFTPFHYATTPGDRGSYCRKRPEINYDLLQGLLDRGADSDSRNLSGQSVCHIVMESISKRLQRHDRGLDTSQGALLDHTRTLLKFLIARGARFEARDKNGRSPLDEAVMSANYDLVKMLFQSGIAANLKVKEYKSCFMLALGLRFDAKYGIIETILDHGFNMSHDAALRAEIWRVAFKSHDLQRQESETCRLLTFLLEKGLAAVGRFADVVAEAALENNQLVLFHRLMCAGSQSPFPEDLYFADLPKKRSLLLQHLQNTAEDKPPQLWVWKCLTGHITCNTSCWSVPILPHRVIDVGISLGSTQTFLHESRGQRDYYVTLSHPWSISAPLKTTLKNIDYFKVSIPWASLSQLLKDAIIWTRNLGVRYLWIDSLCIVQDSDIDWITEASAMSNVYRQSLVTLAVVGAGSENRMISPELGSLGKHFTSRSVTGSSFPSFKSKIDRDYLSAQRTTGLLDSRGWTFQEQILAPRTLSFTSEGVLWECLTMSASTSQPLGCSNQQGHGWEVREARIFKEVLLTGTLVSVNLPENVSLTEILLSHWRHIIKAYSSRSFTRRTDRLMALKGITDLMQSISGSRFIAGLWEDTLTRDLLWFVDDDLPPIGDTPIEAPSWSWLSINARVSFDWHWKAIDGKDRTVHSQITVDHIEFEMDAARSYARGSIWLSGKLFSLDYLAQVIAQPQKILEEEERDRSSKGTAAGHEERQRSFQAPISCGYRFDTLYSRIYASHGLVVGESAGRTLCLALIPVRKVSRLSNDKFSGLSNSYEGLIPNSTTARAFNRAGMLIIDGDVSRGFENLGREQVVLV